MSTAESSLATHGRASLRRLPHGVAYSLVVATFGALYGGVVYLLTASLGTSTFAGSVQLFAVAFLISLSVSIPLHARVQTAVDRWLHARGHTADTLHALFATMTTRAAFGPPVRRSLEIVRRDVGLHRTVLFLLTSDRREFVPVAASGDQHGEERLPADHALISILTTLRLEISRATLRHQSRYANVRTDCLAAFDQLGADLLFPIEVEGRLAGFLGLAGPRCDRLTNRELEILRALSAEFSVLAARVQDDERVRAARLELERFGRYLPRVVAKEVLDGGITGEHARRRNVTVVTCELHELRLLVELLEPAELAEALGRHRELVAAETRREHGTVAYVDTERIQVVFGDPEPLPDHAARALRMALRFRDEARTLWEPWRAQAPGLDVSIGVATGPALVGFLAVGNEVDYQVIGAPRREAETLAGSNTQGEILMTAATSEHAGDDAQVERVRIETGLPSGTAVHRLVAIVEAD